MRNRLVCAVINYKTPALSVDAVSSLIKQCDFESDRVVLVDNDSGDGSVNYFRESDIADQLGNEVILIESPKNGGFSFGNNQAIEKAEAEAYLFLNSDARLESGAIDILLKQLRDNPEIGLVGPLAVGEEGEYQASCFNDRTVANEFLRTAKTGVLTRLFGCFGVREVAQSPAGEARDVDWLSFVAVMVRGDVIRDIGLMDDGFFMYLEDNDYCRRARNKGWRVRYEPKARVIHANKGWSGRHLERQPSFYYESRTRYFIKYYGRLGWLMANLFWTTGRFISILKEQLFNRPGASPIGAWKDIWTWSYGKHSLHSTQRRGK